MSGEEMNENIKYFIKVKLENTTEIAIFKHTKH